MSKPGRESAVRHVVRERRLNFRRWLPLVTAGLASACGAKQQMGSSHAPSTTAPVATALASAAPSHDGTAQEPKFLSSSDPAYGTLEQLQCFAYGNDPHAFRWTGSPEQVRKLRDMLRDLDRRASEGGDAGHSYANALPEVLRQFSASLPTAYEDANAWWILQQSVRLVSDHLAKGSPSWKAPRVGTLPKASLNAQSIPFPELDSYLVVMNAGTFSFAHEFVKIGLDTVHFSAADKTITFDIDKASFDRGARHDVEMLRRLSMAFEDFANGRKVVGHKTATAVYDPLITSMVEAMEVFVVGHEFGHVYLKHSSVADAPLDMITSTGTPFTSAGVQALAHVRTVNRSWGQEAAADVFGYMVLHDLIVKDHTVCTHNGGPDLTEYCLLAPVIFFSLAQMADDATYVLKHKAAPIRVTPSEQQRTIQLLSASLANELNKDFNSGRPPREDKRVAPGADTATPTTSHPPDWARRVLAEAQLKQHLPQNSTDEGRTLAQMGVVFLSNLEKMWGDMLPLWVKISQETPDAPATTGSSPSAEVSCQNPYLANAH